ncbi:SurA N-terminal domain-containing protein [Humidesulfovibrio sp.]
MRQPAKFRARCLGLALLVLVAFGWRSAALADDLVVDGVVALVNGKIITKFEYDERLRPIYEQTRGRQLSTDELGQIATLRRKILEQMVDDMLLQQEAERYKFKVTDAEVEEQIKQFIAKRNISQDEFNRQLALQRLTRPEFANNMRRDMIRHRLIGGAVSNKVVVTDSEVEQVYNERKAEFSKDSMIQLGIILIPSGMSPTELKAEIESGRMTFAEAANRYSQGPGVGNGGDIGFIAWKDLAPEWNAALAGLKPGQITQPVHIQDFAGLLQVISLKEGEELALDSVREQIYQSLHEAKFEKVFQEYMQKLRDKAVVDYRNL